MNQIKYGIKLWSSNSDLYSELVSLYKQKKVDYLELLYVPDITENLKVLIDNKIPIVIHAPNFSQNILFGDGQLEKNHQILKDTLEFAKKLNSHEIIIHPDIGKKDFFIRFLNNFKSEKLIIENMPKIALNGSVCLGYDLDDINEYLKIGNFDFCLDFAHAVKAAISKKIDYKIFLEKMFELKPKIAHLSDGTLKSEKDEHLNLGEGEFDLRFIAKLLKKSNVEKLTFEVPKKDGLTNDLKNIEFFKKLMIKS